MAGPVGGRGPSGPGEECGQLPNLGGVRNDRRRQAVFRGVCTEELGVVLLIGVEGLCLIVGKSKRLGRLVVPVGAEFLDHRCARISNAGVAKLGLDEVGCAAQVVGGVVRSQVRAATDDRAVLHEAARQEELLTRCDVFAGKEHVAVASDHFVGDGHRSGIGAEGQQPHNEEAEDHHDRDALHPALSDHELATVGGRLGGCRCSGHLRLLFWTIRSTAVPCFVVLNRVAIAEELVILVVATAASPEL